MNAREAKRHVCTVAAEELTRLAETGLGEFYEELDSCELLPEKDGDRIEVALGDLILELIRRGTQ